MKRVISIVVCVILAMALMIAPAFAASGDAVSFESVSVPFSVSLDSVSVSDFIWVSPSLGLLKVSDGVFPQSVFDSCSFELFNFNSGVPLDHSDLGMMGDPSFWSVSPFSTFNLPGDGVVFHFFDMPIAVIFFEDLLYSTDSVTIEFEKGFYFVAFNTLIDSGSVYYSTYSFTSTSYMVEELVPVDMDYLAERADTIFSSALSWLGAVADVIFSHPLLLFPCLLPVIGLGVGFFRRLM